MRKILIVVIVISIVSGGWYWYAKKHQTAPGVPAVTDFKSFFPIGETGDPTLLDGTLQDTPNTSPAVESVSPFTQLSSHAVAGYISFLKSYKTQQPVDPKKPKAKPIIQITQKHLIRYVSRANGYIYEIAEGEIPLQISNIYIPNIYEAFFANSGDSALLRFLREDKKTIATYSVPIPPANPDGTRTQKQGVYFPDGIKNLSQSSDLGQIAYLTSTKTTSTITTSSSINDKKTVVLQNPFSEWLISWPSVKSIYVQSKASASVPGYLYQINTTEKRLKRILGGINGLTTSVSPSGLYVLYSEQGGSGFTSFIFNTKTGTTKPLNLSVLPEKCIWLQTEDLICAGNTSVLDAQYPDEWYQGVVSFSDMVYRIYSSSGVFETLYDDSKQSFDMTNLSTYEPGRLLYFIDKKTGLLWQFNY